MSKVEVTVPGPAVTMAISFKQVRAYLWRVAERVRHDVYFVNGHSVTAHKTTTSWVNKDNLRMAIEKIALAQDRVPSDVLRDIAKEEA